MPQRFATTHWSLVLAAARADDPEGRRALEALCEQYWYPLYVFVRRRGYAPENAQDLTQAFFGRLLDTRSVGRASPLRGRFRSFLLAALKNFLINEAERSQALKRGGTTVVLPLDVTTAEGRFAIEPATSETPDDQFNRKWALTLLERALQQMRAEQDRAGRSAVFSRLAPLMIPGRTVDETYAIVAKDLQMTEGAVKVSVHRLRRRLRDILRAEIAQTVDAAEIEEEIQFLIRAIGVRRG